MDPRRRLDPATFVAVHQRGLMRWLTALGCAPDRAEEHCQDAFLAALHHGIDGRDERTARAWLRTAARNLHRMELRREARRPVERSFDEIEQAWLAVGGDDDGGDAALDALRGCLSEAPERDRELLEQRYRLGASRDAMARAFGIGEAAVKQALRRARARLQACVERRLAHDQEVSR